MIAAVKKKIVRYLSLSSAGDVVSHPADPGWVWGEFLRIGFGEHPDYELRHDTAAPDMILIQLGHCNQINAIVGKMRRRFGSGPVLVGEVRECIGLDIKLAELDYVFSSRPDAGNNVCVGGMPLMLVQNHMNHMQHIRHAQWKRSISPSPLPEKTRFCNMVSSNSGWGGVRKEMCKKLMRYKPVDCPGSHINNMPFPKSPYNIVQRHAQKIYFIKDHKFTIAFENRSYPGYVSEKIAHALAVGSIPIYWGSESITDYYNREAFINCHDYSDFDAVVEHVKEVDNNPKLYAEYLNAPPALPHHHYHPWTITTKYRRVADAIYDETVRRREREG